MAGNGNPSREELALDLTISYLKKIQSHYCHVLLVKYFQRPTSSAPVERVVSFSGEATKGKRNRLSDFLEREILLRKNKKYV